MKTVCSAARKWRLGEPDVSGRRAPVGTGEFVEIPCDLVISAVGEKVDSALMAANGIEMGRKGPAFQTNVDGVWCAGDAHRGPATVVEGIADAAAFAEAVVGKAWTYEIPETAYPSKAQAIEKKGILMKSSQACCEGKRCPGLQHGLRKLRRLLPEPRECRHQDGRWAARDPAHRQDVQPSAATARSSARTLLSRAATSSRSSRRRRTWPTAATRASSSSAATRSASVWPTCRTMTCLSRRAAAGDRAAHPHDPQQIRLSLSVRI